jgi:large subunit ribosomal protein L13
MFLLDKFGFCPLDCDFRTRITRQSEFGPSTGSTQDKLQDKLKGNTMKTFSATPADIEKSWIVIDAEGVVLGRLASIVAMRLRGKHKATFTPHMDMGDNVIVINADKVQMTGKKRDENFYWHTGHPGGIKSRTKAQILEGAHPERVVFQAVKRMLPGNRLSRAQLTNLRIYAGAEHPHEAQSPEALDVKSMNKKNTRV